MDIHLLVGVIACQDYLDYNSAERQLRASGFDIALSWTVPCLHLEHLHFLVPEIQRYRSIRSNFHFIFITMTGRWFFCHHLKISQFLSEVSA